ncbi:MAG: class I SAM-dependent methyltransferase [Acidobacteria bacterium]|nr:class I SAM-dependent methyltransferase [Acidobacteriota bacterium]
MSILEIGSWEGRSLLWWLDNVATHSRATVTSIDPQRWGAATYRKMFRHVSEHPRAQQITLIRGLSRHELPRLPEQSLDLIYVVGSHEGRDVLLDACLSFHLLTSGGILLLDDYKWPGDPDHPLDGLPGPAIDAFAVIFGSQLEELRRGYQIAFRRR